MSVPRAYRRLCVTYPAAWRRRHEAAVLTLLAGRYLTEGRSRPSVGDRVYFFVVGLSQRTARTPRMTLPPLFAPTHRFDQSNGLIREREQTAFELVNSRWWDHEPPPAPIRPPR